MAAAVGVRCCCFKRGDWDVVSDGSGKLIDKSTSKVYQITEQEIRQHALGMAECGILGNTIFCTCCAAGRTIRLGLGYHCVKDCCESRMYAPPGFNRVTHTCKDRMRDTGIDFLKCVGAFCLCVATQVMVCRTICDPSPDNMKCVNELDECQFEDGCEMSVASTFRPVKEKGPGYQEMV